MYDYKKAEYYKKTYPAGTRIVLEHMDDPYAPVPSGTRGTVKSVDDMGQLHMNWDNGRTLAVIPDQDSFRRLTEQELAEEQGAPSLSSQIKSASVRASKEAKELGSKAKIEEPER